MVHPEEREKLIATIVDRARGPRQGAPENAAQGPFLDPDAPRLGPAQPAARPDTALRVAAAAARRRTAHRPRGRPHIGFEEARNQPRTVDYPFTLFEIRVNKDGEGEGKLAYCTKIRFDKEKKVIEIENYSSEPVRLKISR